MLCVRLHTKLFKYLSLVQTVKNLPAMQETQVQSLGQEDPWRREWNPLQYSCLENFMDRRTRWATYSPWGCKELAMTEQLILSHRMSSFSVDSEIKVGFSEQFPRGAVRIPFTLLFFCLLFYHFIPKAFPKDLKPGFPPKYIVWSQRS